jgi:hypothetical protein
MNGLKQLRQLALADSRSRHPSLPESARYIKPYKDTTANNLTHAIIDFIRFSGFQAERINCTCRPIDNTKIITDVLGDRRTIGSMKWLPTSGQRGTADISVTIMGWSCKIEVKMKDRRSPDQKAYQEAVERAGGLYWICHSFDEFLNYYNSLT